MKKFFIVAMVGIFFYGTAMAGTAHQFDAGEFIKIAKKNVERVINHNIDTTAMIADMETLITLGVEGCKEHMGEAETPDVEKKLMQIVIDGTPDMKNLTLEQIEPEWHNGGVAKSKGVDIEQFNHFAEVLCHYDGIVHPVTALICIKNYEKIKDQNLLDQIKAELDEVIEHMEKLE